MTLDSDSATIDSVTMDLACEQHLFDDSHITIVTVPIIEFFADQSCDDRCDWIGDLTSQVDGRSCRPLRNASRCS
jgi:hypothetical protein